MIGFNEGVGLSIKRVSGSVLFDAYFSVKEFQIYRKIVPLASCNIPQYSMRLLKVGCLNVLFASCL